MSAELDEVVDNIKQTSTWLRIVFTIGFFFVLYVVGVVVLFLTVAQILFALFSGADNRNLRLLGLNLAEYVNQILRYITYNADFRPFPFNPFPQMDDDSGDAAAAEGVADKDRVDSGGPQSSETASSKEQPAARPRAKAKKPAGAAKKSGTTRKKTAKKGNSKPAKAADDGGNTSSEPAE